MKCRRIGTAAKQALKFGAVMGKGAGFYGKTYAIPTLETYDTFTQTTTFRKRDLDNLAISIEIFIQSAKEMTNVTFLVTEIGCGIAGFKVSEIAPLFKSAIHYRNIHLPLSFWHHLQYIGLLY